MARTARTAWPLLKYRQNKGISMADLVETLGASNNTINRLEKGSIVTRVIAARYFKVLGIDLNNPATWPAQMKLIDHGDRIAVSFDD